MHVQLAYTELTWWDGATTAWTWIIELQVSAQAAAAEVVATWCGAWPHTQLKADCTCQLITQSTEAAG